MKSGSVINFAVVRLSDCLSCMDTQVMRRASCWSDHYLVRAKLHIGFQKNVSVRAKRKKPSCCTQASLCEYERGNLNALDRCKECLLMKQSLQ